MKLRTSTAATLLGLALVAAPLVGQATEEWRSWNQPVDPFRLIGNIYYVGANDIAAYLITSPEGHILIDGGFAETAPIIRDGITRLGFDLRDVKILLNSHAHFDHSGGLAELKEATGARLLVSEIDAPLIERGGKGDFFLGDRGTFPPVEVDAYLSDGEEIRLGDVSLTARLTPGHTRGCTSYTLRVEEAGEELDVVLVCSVSVLPGIRFLDEPSYPGIREDFERAFEVLQSLPCDVFLAPHGGFFGLEEKTAALRQVPPPTRHPFIDPDRYRRYLERGEKRFRDRLEAERQELEATGKGLPDQDEAQP